MDTQTNKKREHKPAKLVFNVAKFSLAAMEAELALFDIAAGDATTPHNLRAEEGIFKQEEHVYVKTVTDSQEGIVVRPAISRASNPPYIIDLSSDDDDDNMGREEEPPIVEPVTDSKEGILTPPSVS